LAVSASPGSAPSESRQRRKWVAHGLSNTVVYGLLHVGTRLPRPILSALSTLSNAIALRILRRTRRDVARNFETALGVPPEIADRLARRQFHEYGRQVVDLWRCRSGRPELTPRFSTLDRDAELLRPLVSGGRGLLLVSAHVGNFEMGAAALRALGIPAAVLGQPELDPAVHRMRLEVRSRLGVESIDTGSSLATALRVRDAIERGLIVALAADRAFAEDSVRVPFFGRETPFLRSPALLARVCGAPILPAFFLRNPDGSYRGVFGTLLSSDASAPVEEDARRLMASVAADVEAVVRQAPEQWFNFFDYFGTAPS
jgi:lauroyl/myristoyl acyltransferase